MLNIFQDCIGLKQANIPTNLISIEEGVWAGCKSLEKVEIPTSVTAIGNCAFDGCENVTSVIISNSVISIGDCAFQNCSNLETITIGSGIKKIGERYNVYFSPGGYVFSNCPEIKDVYCRNKDGQYNRHRKHCDYDELSAEFTDHLTASRV